MNKTKEERAAYYKAYNIANRDRIAIRNKAYAEVHKELIALRRKAHYEVNKERVSARGKAHYIAKGDQLRTASRANYRAHREERLEQQKEYYWAHREQIRARRKIYDSNNRDYFRKYWLQHKFGLSLAEFESLLNSQNNVCAICGKTNWGKRGPCIDHDHNTGKVRGILCRYCNIALGHIGDNPKIALAMINYLVPMA